MFPNLFTTHHKSTWSVMVVMTSCGVLLKSSAGDANVALGKEARQIDSFQDGYALRAVDGNKNPKYQDGFCSHTRESGSQWWIVDLLLPYTINSVAITNRDSNPQHLYGIYVYVSNRNPRPSWFGQIGQLCFKHEGQISPGGPHSFPCDKPVTGRYVYVYKPTQGWLIMCEVEVMADDAIEEEGSGLPFKEFNVQKGMKCVGIDPFYSVTITEQSGLKCVAMCLSQKTGVATLIHFNTSTRRCECVQRTGLVRFVSYIEEEEWVLMEVVSNFTPDIDH